MLRLQPLALLQQLQLHHHGTACLVHLQQHLLPATAFATVPQQQHQQQHQQQQQHTQRHKFLANCFQQYSSAAVSSVQQTIGSGTPIRYPSKHEQRAAHLKFCQQRAAWRREVKAIRKQWLANIKNSRDVRAVAVQSVRQEIAELQKARMADRQRDHGAQHLGRKLRDAERAVDVAKRRLQAARREEWRQQRVERHKRGWHKRVIEASSNWVTPQTLEARIAAALDNPRSL